MARALPCTKLEGLVLERNYLGPKGVSALAGVLLPADAPQSQDRSCGLLSLHLAVNRARDEGAEAFAEALGGQGFLPKLEVLDLGGNLISDVGACALAQALSKQGLELQRLGLARNKLSSVAGERLAEAVEAGSNSSIQAIEMDGNEQLPWTCISRVSTALRRNCRSLVPYDPLACALAACRAGARAVDLRGLPLGAAGLERLGRALEGRRVGVAALRLGDVGLGDGGAERLAGGLRAAQRTLTELDVSWNRIGALGAEGLVAGLDRAPALGLVTLDMDCNDLGDAGASAIASMLERRPPGAAEQPEGGACRSLRVLRLASNGVGPLGAARLAAALREHGAGLAELELGRNRLGPAGAAALAGAVARPEVPLRRLGLGVNRLMDTGAEALAEALGARGQEGGLPLELGLRGNLIGDAGAAALAKRVSSGVLVGLGLEYNKVTGRGAEALAAGLLDGLLAARLREGLSAPGSADAVVVSLEGNPAGPGGELALQEAFRRARNEPPGCGHSWETSESKRQRLD